MEDLRDQETDEERCLKPEFMVVIGICTHLGCVPLPDQGDYNGSFCPCHGCVQFFCLPFFFFLPFFFLLVFLFFICAFFSCVVGFVPLSLDSSSTPE